MTDGYDIDNWKSGKTPREQDNSMEITIALFLFQIADCIIFGHVQEKAADTLSTIGLGMIAAIPLRILAKSMDYYGYI